MAKYSGVEMVLGAGVGLVLGPARGAQTMGLVFGAGIGLVVGAGLDQVAKRRGSH